MIPLDELIAATGAEVLTTGSRASFEGFAHDSRMVTPGECFVAVRGPHRDGHDFLEDAVERGAGALLVERARLEALSAASPDLLERLQSGGAVLLAVDDTRAALQAYAAHILRRWHPTIVAVTGATGKTTTKEAIADVLAAHAPTFRSWRNYNDLLGIPLSLGRLEPEQRFAVLELAADHPGEMRALAALTRPTVAVVTNVSPTHLQYFGSLGAYANELAQLPAALPPEGLAILNGDDEVTRAMREHTAAQVALFGALPAGNGRGMEPANQFRSPGPANQFRSPGPANQFAPPGPANQFAPPGPANQFAPEWRTAAKSASADSERAKGNNTVGARRASPASAATRSTRSTRSTPSAPPARSGEYPTRYAVVPLGSRESLALTMQPLDEAGNPTGEPVVFPNLIGDHWATTVLAALTVGRAFGVDPDAAIAALREMQPLPGRMRLLEGADGLTLLDDTHNATPASASAGLAVLDAIGTSRYVPRIAVLGELLHLGDGSADAHLDLGHEVAARADFLVTRGVLAERIAEGARHAGMDASRIAVTHTAADAAQAVRRFASDAIDSGLAERAASEDATPGTRVPEHASRFPLGSELLERAPLGLESPTTEPASADFSPPAPYASTSAPRQGNALVYLKGSEEARMEQVTALLLAHPERAERLLDRQTQAWQRMVVMRADRPTWLEIDFDAIAGNTRRLKERVGPDVRVLVSLKADAYGHGALRVARTALQNGASWLGVATVSEAQPLRAAGITAPILIFGYIAPWQVREAVQLDLRATVYSLDAAQSLARAAQDLGREMRVHVKVDTGMARLGLRSEDVAGIVALVERLHELPGLVVEGLFTHFATADSPLESFGREYALRQHERFEHVLAALDARGLRPPIVHAANSAALLTLPQAHYDMVRPGIAVYGLAPSPDVPLPVGFRPALAFKTQVAQVKEIPAGEGISYGATYITEQPTCIAVLPVGYADGFRRAPANWGEVLVRGQRAPILGRVCMDQCMVDVSRIPGVRVGDEVVLIGRQGDDELSAEAIAARLGTINYEVVAALLARVPRVSRA